MQMFTVIVIGENGEERRQVVVAESKADAAALVPGKGCEPTDRALACGFEPGDRLIEVRKNF